MDAAPFSSLAQVRILLLPVGQVRRSAFEKWSGLVRTFENIRLGDIPPDSREEKNRFIPSPLSPGYLHLSYTSHPPPAWHSSMSLFRPSAFPLGVIGIADCTTTTSLPSIVAEFKASLAALFPSSSPFPFASRCFAFEEGDGNVNINLGTSLPELVTIPSLMGNKQVYVGTLLAELCHDILSEFPALVRALDSPEVLDTISASLLPTLLVPPDGGNFILASNGTLDNINRHNSAPVSTTRLPSRSSTPFEEAHGGPSRSTMPPIQRSNTGLNASSNTHRQSTLTVGNQKKRSSAIGASASNGRVAKIIGDLYLLSGKTVDANYWYTEAISLFRTQQDSIWNASALEGQCTIEVLDAWSAGESLHTSLAGNVLGDPWANIADKMGQAVNLYSRATPSSSFAAHSTPSGDSEHASLALLYTEAVLRFTHLLFSIWSAKGWNPLSLASMLKGGLPLTLTHDRPSHATMLRLSSITSITRSYVANIASQAHGPFLIHLQPHDQIRVLSRLASIYSCLGFRRKEAFVLRELQAAIMDLVVCARDESRSAGAELLSGGSNGLGISGVSFGPTSEKEQNVGAMGVRESDLTDGNDSVIKVVRYICQIYGIDIGRVKILEPDAEGKVADEVISASRASSDVDPKPFGWPELQVGVVREAVAIAEALPDHPTVAQFALSTLKGLSAFLTPNEQFHLHGTASRALATSRRRGDNRQIEFWSEGPVVSIEISPLPLVRLPVEHPRRDLEPHQSSHVAVAPGRRGLFIYQPGGKQATISQVVVQNESIEFMLTLRNPYMFDFELQSLILSTSGPSFHSQPISVVIPANSFHVLPLHGLALEPGLLTIRGYVAQLPGGAAREFLLPLSDEVANEKAMKRQSIRQDVFGRIKTSGLEANAVHDKPSRSSIPASSNDEPRFLQCNVVPEQPLLRVRRSSLTHGALMLYDGEMSTIRLTVENISSLPVDFFKLTFDDSTMLPAQQALAEGDLSIAEAYEAEYDLVRRPVFRWDPAGQGQTQIGPGKKTALTITCLGRIGCTNGSAHLAYSYAHRPSDSEETDVFYTRQLVYPVLVTVYHTLQCNNLDIVPFHAPSHRQQNNALQPNISSTLAEESTKRLLLDIHDDEDYCLLSLDVTNMYGLPFEVTLERKQEGAPPALASRVVPPGSTSRLFIPVKRFTLSPAGIARPIPTLSDRQFIVAKDKLSPEEERLQRELFWYRESLLEIIQGRWTEPGTSRHGELSLRQQRLTMPMFECLRRDPFQIDVSVDDESPAAHDTAIRRKDTTWHVKPYEMVHFTTRVLNLTMIAADVLMSWIPVAPTRAEDAIFEGWLSDIQLGTLKPDQISETSLGVCFVSEGRFQFQIDVGAAGDDEGSNRSSRLVNVIVE